MAALTDDDVKTEGGLTDNDFELAARIDALA